MLTRRVQSEISGPALRLWMARNAGLSAEYNSLVTRLWSSYQALANKRKFLSRLRLERNLAPLCARMLQLMQKGRVMDEKIKNLDQPEVDKIDRALNWIVGVVIFLTIFLLGSFKVLKAETVYAYPTFDACVADASNYDPLGHSSQFDNELRYISSIHSFDYYRLLSIQGPVINSRKT